MKILISILVGIPLAALLIVIGYTNYVCVKYILEHKR